MGVEEQNDHTETISLLLGTDWLARHLDDGDLIRLDARGQEAYTAGHIPGARPLPLEEITTRRDGVEGMLVDQETFAEVMGRLGVTADSSVVVYDDHWGMAAARIVWALARYGNDRAGVLDGGWDRWIDEERPISVETGRWPHTLFQAEPVDRHLATYEWITDRVEEADLCIVDTRTAVEYAQGHLPGALQWDWTNAVPGEGWDTMRPEPDLVAALTAAGITPDREIVTYCRSGVRAAHTYLVLRHLGYPRVRNYDGSWLEWGKRRDTGNRQGEQT